MKERENFTQRLRRALALTLTFVIVFSMMPAWVANATEADEPTPVADENGKIKIGFQEAGTEVMDACDVEVSYIQEDETKTLDKLVDEDTGACSFQMEMTDPATEYTIKLTPSEGYGIASIVDVNQDSKDITLEYDKNEDGTYSTTYVYSDEQQFLDLKVELKKTQITLNATTEGERTFSGGDVNVYKIEGKSKVNCTPNGSSDGTNTYHAKIGETYSIEIEPKVEQGYEIVTGNIPNEFVLDEDTGIYSKTFSCTVDSLAYECNVAYTLRNVKLNLEIGEHGGVQINGSNYNGSTEVNCKYGTSFDDVRIIAEAGYTVKSAILGEDELEIQRESDTVAKISIPSRKEEQELYVEFEQVKVEDVSELPEDIELVFSNEADVRSKNVSGDEITYVITKGNTVTVKSVSGKKINFNKESIHIYDFYNVFNYELEKKIKKEKTLDYIWELSPTSMWEQTGYKLDKPITFIFDTVSPTVVLQENGTQVDSGYSTWLSGNESNLSITGSITDQGTEGSKYKAGVDRVVWSTTALDENEILTENTNVVKVAKDGDFTISLSQTPQENTTYYLYGIDKASNISAEVVRTYLVDKGAPTVTDIKTTELVEKRGIYYTRNEKVSFTVTAADTDAGVKSITIYQDGVEKETQNVDNYNSATFTITLSDTADNMITASATDSVGNTTAETDFGKFSNGAVIIRDTSVPEMNLNLAGFYSNTNEDGRTTYYENKDENLTLTVGQKKSGLNSVQVMINGVSLTEDVNGKSFVQANADYKNAAKKKTTTDSFVISTSEVAALADGDYEIIITASSNVSADEVFTQTYYLHKENQAPVISGYNVPGASAEAVSTTDSYGYFSNTSVAAELSLSDGATGAGIETVSYHFVDQDGKAGSDTELELNKRPGEDVVVQIPVAPDFKGYVYVKTTDHLGNTTTDYYTTTGIITEKAESHADKASVDLSAAATGTKDTNGNNLYAGDTAVAVTVADTYSGIKSIEWSVNAPFDTANNRSGAVTIDNNGAVSDAAWSVGARDKNLVTQMTYSIPITNNSNNITVWVKLTDRAGNTTEKSMILSIDKSAPVISLGYNEVTPDETYNSIYKDTRVATVMVKERSFDAGAVAWNITSTHGSTAQVSGWTEIPDAANPDNNTYVATVTFAADDDYSFAMNYTDRAGNAGSSFGTQTFTIDQTIPTIEVTMDGQPNNSNYFAAGRTATVKVTEHNFDSNRIVVRGTATDNGNTTTFPVTSGWTTDGDVHTATISFDTDGVYAFTVDGIDEAGNVAEQNATSEFVVDLTEPTIEISGVEDFSANNDVVAPVIQFSDTNYNEGGAKIELVGANHGVVEANGAYSSSKNGQVFTFADFSHEQDVDDIYTLTATEIDFAGNETSQSITFSVNRFGSVYVFDHSLKEIEGTYIKEPIDVVLTETNVDSLSMDSIKVTVSENGAPKDLSEGADYTVATTGGSGSWSQYTYTIDKSVFQGDGSYLVTLYSVDNAGNVNENINESKKAEIDFGVDGTAPVIVPINIEDGESYNAQVYNATASVVDNLVLQDVNVTLDGKEIACTQEGDDINFEIPEASSRQEVVITARDAAGNEMQCEVANFLVSTNTFVRVMNNTPVVAAVAGGVVAVGGGAGAFIGFRKKKVIRIKRKK